MTQRGGRVTNAEHHRDKEYISLVDEGAALFGNKQYALALTRFWKAFRLRPSSPVVLFNIARTMEELNDPKCEDFYAAAASQGNADALYQLAAFCLGHGRTEEAVEHLSAFLKQHKGKDDKYTEWARDAIHRLYPGPLLVWSKGSS
jgi:tetratricopeptide (TPR) repeat protein